MTSVTDHTAEPAAEHTIDIHTTAGKLAELHKRREETLHPVGEAAVEKVHAKGKLTARERIYALLDEDSFVELDALARHRSTNFGLENNRPLGDGVVTGYGTIDGRDVCIFSQDATVFGGSLGEVYGEKIVKVQELAIKTGRPLIGINDGAGARIQEGVVSLGLYSQIFRNNILASGVIPQISLIMGAAAGGHVYSPALTDFVVMVDQTSQMFITGPDVIKTVTGEDVTMEELGGAHTHMAKSGTLALRRLRRAGRLRLRPRPAELPAAQQLHRPAALRRAGARGPHRGQPHRRGPRAGHADPGLGQPALRHARGDHPHPRRRRVPRGPERVTRRTSSSGSAASTAGRSASWPTSPPSSPAAWTSTPRRRPPASCGPATASTSRSSCWWTCRASCRAPARNTTASSAAAPSCCYAYGEATVPKITVITRKAYGGAYCVMGSKDMGCDVNVAWPTAQIAVMGASGAVGFVYRQQLKEAAKDGQDVDALRLQLQQEYEDTLVNPYVAAERGYVDAVIPPSHTRGYIATALRLLERKISHLPPKKHGNIPYESDETMPSDESGPRQPKPRPSRTSRTSRCSRANPPTRSWPR